MVHLRDMANDLILVNLLLVFRLVVVAHLGEHQLKDLEDSAKTY